MNQDLKYQVLRLRPGDILWIRLGADSDSDDVIATIRDAVVESVPQGCAVILTKADTVRHMESASLAELVAFRDSIDATIAIKSKQMAGPEA